MVVHHLPLLQVIDDEQARQSKPVRRSMQQAPIENAHSAEQNDDFAKTATAVEVEDDKQRRHRSNQLEERPIIEQLHECGPPRVT